MHTSSLKASYTNTIIHMSHIKLTEEEGQALLRCLHIALRLLGGPSQQAPSDSQICQRLATRVKRLITSSEAHTVQYFPFALAEQEIEPLLIALTIAQAFVEQHLLTDPLTNDNWQEHQHEQRFYSQLLSLSKHLASREKKGARISNMPSPQQRPYYHQHTAKQIAQKELRLCPNQNAKRNRLFE